MGECGSREDIQLRLCVEGMSAAIAREMPIIVHIQNIQHI